MLVSVFFGWGLFHRTRKQSPASKTKPLWNNVVDDGEVQSISREKNPPMQVQTNFQRIYVHLCVLISIICICDKYVIAHLYSYIPLV